eukprot:PLAT2428.1.p2 GENE.PLAT2428.1~~PLAT2428.1.p2  ORF type:complete len:510 (+),score=189.38 PLAT2428.1:34-1530(+)
MEAPHPSAASRPISTAGAPGQAFAVWQKNWKCPECKAMNFPRRATCYRCRAKRPKEAGDVVWDDAMEALASGKGSEWKEAMDPATQHIYYYNTRTREVSWERPKVMGPAPHATGWFGRGKVGVAEIYAKRNAEWLKRPARKQADFMKSKDTTRPEGANEFNIWYGRWMGEHWSHRRARDEPAETRCKPDDDAGFTRADYAEKSKGKTAFCIHFARGCCAKGAKCTFFHRVPTPADDAVLDMLHDCFGRERHASHREDMTGVGSFQSNSRTLFIGGLRKEDGYDIKKQLYKHFSVWGEVENINFISRLSIAFVRYRLRSNAEFAKEAMDGQTMENDEILSVNWAHDDPNPVAKEAERRSNYDAMLAALAARGYDLTKAEFEYPEEYRLRPAKRLKVAGGRAVDAVYDYPDTESQFDAAEAEAKTDGSAEGSVEAVEESKAAGGYDVAGGGSGVGPGPPLPAAAAKAAAAAAAGDATKSGDGDAAATAATTRVAKRKRGD